MALRFPILIFAAVLCLPAAAMPGRAADPESDDAGIRDLILGILDQFKFGRSDKTTEELAIIRKRLENEWVPPIERCALLQQLAQLESSRGNYRQAIEDVRAYAGVCNPTGAEKMQTFKILGQLHMALDPPDFEHAIEFLRKSADGGDNPDPDVYLYLGMARALTGQYREAEAEARRAIERAKEAREDDYRLLLYCHVMRKDHSKTIAVLDKMLPLFPVRDEYLSALVFTYLELGRERDAFLIQVVRYELGYLNKETELVSIAYLYLLHGNPHRAARILGKEIRDGHVPRTTDRLKTLADMWSMAREHEKARLSLAEAADVGRNGELEFQVALTYYEDEDWNRAEKFLRRALREGGLKQPCTTQILLGYTLYYKDDKSGALRQFEGARIAGCQEEANRSLRSIAAQITGQHGDLLFRRIAVKAAVAERAWTASGQALKAARKALAAPRAEIRGQWLAAYERDRDTARRYLDSGALAEARDDRATMELMLAGLPADKLTPKTRGRARQLAQLSRRRVALLEGTRDNLRRAANFAARTRRKDAM